MKGFFTGLAVAIIYLWQLPQNLLGLLLVAFLRPEDVYEVDASLLCYASRMRGGISLGRYIIVRSELNDRNTEKHELGHSRQSFYLGPLYLIVIGLPSLIWAWWWNKGRGVSYYSFYTERWADRLGEVER